MGQGINRVILIGNLGKDPEVRYTQSGQAVASFSLATAESWTDKQGQRQERTEWHRIVAWGKTAELCGEHLSKGRQVYLEGKLQTRQYQDKDDQTRYTTEVVCNTVQFLGSKGDGQQRAPHPADDLGYGDTSDPIPQAPQQTQAPRQQPMQGMQQQPRQSYPKPPEQRPRGGQQYAQREPGYDDQDDTNDVPF